MPTFTSHYNLSKPLVNSATDQDLWGGYLNTNFDIIDSTIYANSLTGVPTGTLLAHASPTAPTNYLLCYGQAVNRTTYAGLFTAIGAIWGAGDGSTTFNIPDLRGRVPFGQDTMGGTAAGRLTSAVSGVDGSGIGAVGGDQSMQVHNHGVSDPGHQHAVNSNVIGLSFGGVNIVTLNTGSTTLTNAATTGITINTAGSGVSQNIPPAVVSNWIIRI